MEDDIPPLPALDDCPPIRTQADLERLWRALMGPLGFAGRSLWMLALDQDDRPHGPLVQIDDLPADAADACLDGVVDVLRHGVMGEASVAFLVTVPGRRPMPPGDVELTRGLGMVASRAGLSDRPVHWANGAVLLACTPEDAAA